ncbi:MAG: peroxiredoxin [Planctomycetes bacterium]|nr:peroxiredoxin [Planctomycetota bacterium]MCW8135824.1 peroxiredoxin [Planctomycetota bacterium]
MAIQVGSPAPDFAGDAVIGGDIKKIQLSDFKGKWVVLFFYPLDFTFVCPTEIVAFNDHLESFKKLNTEVIACSVDSKFSHLAWNQTSLDKGGLGGVKYPLLSDLTKNISRDYGVLLEQAGIALRGLFLIDPDGVLQHSTVNALNVGRSVKETLRVVKAFQWSKQHGDVCPANWDEGAEAIKPTAASTGAYLAKTHK